MESVDDEMRAGGWRDESAVRMSETLVKLAAKIRLVDELPAVSERPWDMPRGLDPLGIHGGEPSGELLHSDARFGKLPDRASGNVLVTARLSVFEGTRSMKTWPPKAVLPFPLGEREYLAIRRPRLKSS
jgi:hypothetical protein